MTLQRTSIDGRPAFVGEISPGLIKIVFDDGGTAYAVEAVSKSNPYHDPKTGEFAEGPGGGGGAEETPPVETIPPAAATTSLAQTSTATPDWKTAKEATAGLWERHRIVVNNDADNSLPEGRFVERAKEVDGVFNRMNEEFPGFRDVLNLPGGIYVNKGTVARENVAGKAAVAFYDPLAKSIQISGSIQTGESRIKANDWTVGGSRFGSTLRHELGHALDAKLLAEARRAGIYPPDGTEDSLGSKPSMMVYAYKQSLRGKGVSTYGKTSAREYFAEAFSLYTHPDYATSKVRVQPDLERAFDAVLKKKVQ